MENELEKVLRCVSQAYDIPVRVILSRNQGRVATEARCVAIHIAFMRFKTNVSQLVSFFHRCKSAIYWAIDKYSWLLKHDRQIRENYQSVIRLLEK
ncbi:MAG: hypothetical protein HDS14_00425 [Bacteroides sp.]|nr:hypothetical protein [Bacteroides sp.]